QRPRWLGKPDFVAALGALIVGVGVSAIGQLRRTSITRGQFDPEVVGDPRLEHSRGYRHRIRSRTVGEEVPENRILGVLLLYLVMTTLGLERASHVPLEGWSRRGRAQVQWRADCREARKRRSRADVGDAVAVRNGSAERELIRAIRIFHVQRGERHE